MNIIKHIIIKEFLQLKRDPRLFAVIFIAPVFQLLILGFAANMDINNIQTAIYDQDRTFTSRSFIDNMERSGYFSINYYTSSYKEINDLIDKGDVFTAIIIPKDFEYKIKRNEQVKLQAIFDASDGNKAAISAGYVQGIIASFTKELLLEAVNRTGMKRAVSGSLTPEIRIWYNPDLKTRRFMVPSIMGLLLMVITLMLMSMAVVKEREIGTLEQLIVTPIKPYQLITGKVIPFIILGFMASLVAIAVMVFGFDIPVRGNFFYLMFASFAFVLSALGLGLFVSTISRTQQQAMMIAMFGLMMPMIYLSGFAFPIENMPVIIQYITYFIPMRYFITILRGVVLKGLGFTDLIPETAILLIFGIVILYLSSLRFKKRLE